MTKPVPLIIQTLLLVMGLALTLATHAQAPAANVAKDKLSAAGSNEVAWQGSFGLAHTRAEDGSRITRPLNSVGAWHRPPACACKPMAGAV